MWVMSTAGFCSATAPAITMPPILLGTWYGMNFEHMPEVDSPYGYWGALVFMVVTTTGMFLWCRRRGWI